MSKDPAFLFYTNDFQSGTLFFTDEQVGKYIRLLMAQHQHGHLSEKQVLFICKTHDTEVLSKFVKDENGMYFNEKLESVINARAKFTESRRNNRLGKKKDNSEQQEVNNTSNSYVEHMENENEIENINKDENGKTKKFPFKKSLLDLGVDEIVVDTFLEVRKKKKAVNSELAFTKISNEIIKSGLTPNEAITIAAEKSWSGFEADWVKEKNFSQKQENAPSRRTTNEIFDKVKQDILNGQLEIKPII